MPIPVQCPSCGTNLRAPDSAAGRKVKCPKCATPFPVPTAEEALAPVSAALPARQGAPQRRDEAHHDDDSDCRREPPRRKRANTQGPGTGLQLGMGIASLSLGAIALIVAWIPLVGALSWPVSGLGLILGIIGLIIAFTREGRGIAFPIAGSSTSLLALGLALYWIFFIHRAANSANEALQQAGERWRREAERIAKDQQKFNQPFNNPGALVPASGAVPMNNGKGEVKGQLAKNDPRDRVKLLSPCKVYTVALTAGKTYQMDMTSAEVDSFLRLEDAQGRQLAADDDSGGFPNPRFTYHCPKTGAYRLVATSLRGATGNFTLKVDQQSGQPLQGNAGLVAKGQQPLTRPGGGAPAQPSGALALVGGKGELKAKLLPADPRDPQAFGSPCRVYTVDLQAGHTYQIDMLSRDFDAYLRLQNPRDVQVAFDDDGGEGFNARIAYNCTQTGTYRIVATSLGGRTGNFTLKVEQK